MKKIVVSVIIAFCVIYLVSAPIFGGLKNVVDEKSREDIFVELWHIDTFEGGKNSRGEFLKSVAVALNKANKNEFIVVKTITEMELVERLKVGQLPEMFSFGTGLGGVLQKYLVENNVGTGQRGFLDECASADGKILATPYAFGGYFEIGKGKPLIYANGTEQAPCLAKYFGSEYGEFEKVERVEKPTTYEAYLAYIERGGTLIGTQRDVVRISQRIENGKMSEVEIKPLTAFTDMVMAVGMTESATKKKREVCEKYIDFLLGEKIQSKLAELRLFPARKINIYSIPYFSEFEKNLEKIRCVNIFTPNELLKKNNQLAINAMLGNEKDKKFIDDFFVAN